MAIDIQCPACQKPYRLKDDLAGKRVTCGNPDCRKPFLVEAKPIKNGTVPAPALKPGAAKPVAAKPAVKVPAKPAVPPPHAVDADAMALAMFSEEQEDTKPVDQRTIAMKCEACEHLWTEPWSRQGKNVLCPECRHRTKVPEQKKKEKEDWRKGGTGPSMAKREQLEGVVASGDAGFVSGQSLREAGLGRPELEPRPLWQKVFVVAFPLALIGLIALAVMTFNRQRGDSKEIETMKLAMEDVPGPDTTLPPSEAPLFRAALSISAGEYAARRDKKDEKELQEGLNHFAKARQELEAASPSMGRDMLFLELAMAQLALGGDDDKVKENQRIRFAPQPVGAARAKINQKTYDVQGELKQTLTSMRNEDKPVALEARLQTIRRLTRELAKSQHADIAEKLIPVLFNETEQVEATAQVGIELLKATNDPAKVDDLVKGIVQTLGAGRPATGSLIALGQSLPTPPPALKAPTLPPGTGPVDEGSRTLHSTLFVLKNSPQEAIDLAKRPGRSDGRLKALALIAELSAEPGPAVQAAADIVNTDGKKKELGTIPDFTLIRLAAQAGRANQPDKLETFTKAISKDDARAWAKADFLRQQFLAAPTPKVAEESVAEIPVDPREHKLGHAWARLALARNNSAAGDKKTVDGFDRWGKGTYRPFGLAGYALGLQDRNTR